MASGRSEDDWIRKGGGTARRIGEIKSNHKKRTVTCRVASSDMSDTGDIDW
jgi:hypothetical protein